MQKVITTNVPSSGGYTVFGPDGREFAITFQASFDINDVDKKLEEAESHSKLICRIEDFDKKWVEKFAQNHLGATLPKENWLPIYRVGQDVIRQARAGVLISQRFLLKVQFMYDKIKMTEITFVC